MSKQITFRVPANTDPSTTSSQNLIDLPAGAPRFGRLLYVTIAAGESTSLALAATETGVGSFSSLAPGYASLNGNNQIAAGDTVSANSVVTVFGEEGGDIQMPTATFSAVTG